MKKIYIAFNLILIGLIGVSIFLYPDHETLSIEPFSKSIQTSVFTGIKDSSLDEVPTNSVDSVVSNFEQDFSLNIASASVITDVLETQIGSLSAYGPNCSGCSGHLAGGYDATNGNYWYFDSTYGNVRIVAADKQYPYGTIVRVKGTKLGDFQAIVLDRGGGIGFGKRYLFDLLCTSEADALQFGSYKSVTFEILRYGY